ncbi:FtsW/RodA/SpoVE family cell cycle protein [Heyndrickxia ginsengihumi]|uniref:Cell cycle protein n=1 Tax=Heyndrickxia ginsengihumi TaxID=363870 RepID=A0A0A6VBJ7_9BACI|nr:FtsW/RodA/SpoVE family cell cycle protein [Heyndrickxia ginsengihumi]KHD84946.1 cell cycle protein [Heyndrickxia ginsengihumi]MBE6182999.1 rod shape-determining protein RodA [Bacillus sp. (in: firmicutes)]MCM3023301.1 rod shape-determining protein RodA [Heyndrickxia ginsengihumi]NEY19253.1 rod shape-determining protein RodA [Heyndrickxia ginsengihumi]
MSSQNNNGSKVDYGIVLTLLLLCVVSLVSIYSAQQSGQYHENFVIKQIFWYIVGAGLIVLAVQFDSDQLKRLSWYAYGFGIALLCFLIIAPSSIAPTINGAKNWFKIPFLGTIQPSEFMKVFLILVLARLISDHHQKNGYRTVQSDLWLIVKLGIATFVPLMLIIKQDLGTSLVFMAILIGMIFTAGITWKLLLPFFAGFAGIVAIIFYFVLWKPKVLETYLGIKTYQFGRIYSWLDPYNYSSTEGYHLIRSLLAIGSGQTFGKGYGSREVYLPESQTDFIFSVIGEQFGFIGASIVVSLFFMLIYHMTKTGLETKNDFYTYICAGVISMITFHVFQNIGMTVGVLPITGIPLPFISYGGSSLMGNMLGVGLIMSIRYHYKKYMFSNEK